MDLEKASPFSESIILATICGRTLCHRQQSVVERVYSHVPQQFWERHQWLYSMLKTRHNNFLQQYPPTMQHTNCMLLFTNMMAQTTVLYLCKTIESITWETDEYCNAISDFKQRSLLAAKAIVNLTRSLSQLSYFKVNTRPLPIPFFLRPSVFSFFPPYPSLSLELQRLSYDQIFKGPSFHPAPSGVLYRLPQQSPLPRRLGRIERRRDFRGLERVD